MGEYLLGIDNGLTLSKAALFDLAGREVKVASRRIEVQYPKPGYTDRNMDTVWQTTAEAIREVIETSGINPSEILAIGNSGHGNGLYMLDREDRVFRPASRLWMAAPAILWRSGTGRAAFMSELFRSPCRPAGPRNPRCCWPG